MKLAFPYLLAAMSAAMGSAAFAELAPPSDDVMAEPQPLSSTDDSLMDESEMHDAESSFPPFQNGHVYLGARAGWAAYQDACGSDALDCSEDTFGYGLYLGYQFNSWLALEGGMTSYGSPDARYSSGDVDADVYGAEIAAKLSHPLTERLDVFTRLGGVWQRIDKEFSPMPDAIESSEWNLMSSIGMSYRLSQRWSVRGEYQFIDGIGDGDVEQADSHFTSIGLTYHFGQEAPAVEEPVVEPVPVVEPEPVRVPTPLSLSAESLFSFDSSELKQATSLDLLAEQLANYPNDTIRIVGYTDASGPEEYNQRLSERRAQSVADYLESKGIDASRLTVIGLGENSPVAANDTAEGRAQNRRVEVLFDTTIEETQEVIDEPAINESMMEQ
ncbi:OmpA family protein [Vibrio parahaemolyticus]|nr:OmpA family protein [Vibrio parahaemolyticus]